MTSDPCGQEFQAKGAVNRKALNSG